MQPPSWNTRKVNPLVSVLALNPGEKVSPVIVRAPVASVSVLLVRATIRPEPAPWTVIPFPEIVTPEVQVQVPEGIVTVSPVAAELMADCISPELHVLATMVLAFASRLSETVKRNAHNSHFNLVIGTVPYLLRTPHFLAFLTQYWAQTRSKSTVRGDSLGTVTSFPSEVARHPLIAG